MEAVVARMEACAGLKKVGGNPDPWNRELWGRGGNERVDVTAAASGEDKKVGVKGLIMSFWNASFAWKKKCCMIKQKLQIIQIICHHLFLFRSDHHPKSFCQKPILQEDISVGNV